FKDESGRETSLTERRFVHMRHCHLAGLETKLTAHNWSGKITVRSALDGRVLNAIGMYTPLEKDKRHLEPIEASITDDILYLKMQTIQSHVTIAEAASTSVFSNDKPIATKRTN